MASRSIVVLLRTASPLVLFPCLAGCETRSPAADAASALIADVATARRVEITDSPEFERAFRRIHHTVVSSRQEPDGNGLRLTYCTVDDAGTAYYAGRDSRDIHSWVPGEPSLRKLPVEPDQRAGLIGALAWSADERMLYVLDVGRNRVLRYGRDGGLVDYVFLNAGQGGLTLTPLSEGRLLVGGERWELEGEATLAAVYNARGQFLSAFFPMDPAVHAQNMDTYVPVLSTALSGDEFLLAVPTSYRITRMSAAGEVLGSYGDAPSGYFPPRPLANRTLPQDEMQVWRQSWTPLLFLHAGGGRVFAGFQIHRPRRSFQLEVFDPAGGKLASNLVTGRRPACGAGGRLYFVEPVSADSLELSVYEYRSDPSDPTVRQEGAR